MSIFNTDIWHNIAECCDADSVLIVRVVCHAARTGIDNHCIATNNFDTSRFSITEARKLPVPPKLVLQVCLLRAGHGHFPPLTYVDVSGNCGIGDDALARIPTLTTLIARENPRVNTALPFAASLSVLDACGDCGLADAGLRCASELRVLNAAGNPKITTVEPFATTLTDLNASEHCAVVRGRLMPRACGIGDSGLVHARALVRLAANYNKSVSTVTPFSETLTHLEARGYSGISDAGLVSARRLESLDVTANPCVLSLAPFAATLTSLEAGGRSAISDQALKPAYNLRRLITRGNPNVTPTCDAQPVSNTVAAAVVQERASSPVKPCVDAASTC